MTGFGDIESEREGQVFAEGHPGFAKEGEEEYRSYERTAHVHVLARNEEEAEEVIAEVMRVVDEALREGPGRTVGTASNYIELDESPAEEV